MWFGAAAVGVVIGFLGGLLGKGGSAIATPMLHALGFPAIVAVASPLPATVPSTALAASAYARHGLVDWRAARWTVAVGVPATALGAVLTRWIGGGALVLATDVVLIGLGIRLLITAGRPAHPDGDDAVVPVWALASVGATVGLVSGLLANSGGFLLAPLFATVLRLPIKAALATSLAVAAVLAIPGTVVHVALGHVDWALVAVFAVTSVPLSLVGARVALRIDAHRLERLYGGVLVVLGAAFLLLR